ncbi:MAG TPA: peptide deformylase [Bacteroidales bacterium]|nr:peptide deformylase [Bacteroidales bacterium]
MILPIVAYGHPTLKKVAEDISPDYPGLHTLISDMWETMYAAHGLGLAAPQVNKPIRLFLIDATPYAEEHPELKDFKKVFINAHITSLSGDDVIMSEGCLSIPGLNEDVNRKNSLTITYVDENFVEHTEDYSGFIARVIQHEYDHIEGMLYVDRLSAMRKMLLKNKLKDISEGRIDVDYKMIFPGMYRRKK